MQKFRGNIEFLIFLGMNVNCIKKSRTQNLGMTILEHNQRPGFYYYKMLIYIKKIKNII